jgi:hypothetical protein
MADKGKAGQSGQGGRSGSRVVDQAVARAAAAVEAARLVRSAAAAIASILYFPGHFRRAGQDSPFYLGKTLSKKAGTSKLLGFSTE